ncbi:alanine racemase [Enterococcus sp. BWT-B8]|uniref:alanine racemase n=1 Tax=Enterococcus sp. BWT-B8 TaxID=2885157 RepID=UPI001E5BE3DE|nr:alanine racemase [Enterococcus sp. BWT-B8]MCB5953358.1 alanine racemase [Enterococcus sp. BWT-B8]
MTKKNTKTINMSSRSSGIDQFRLIAAVMVVVIHTFPFGSFAPYLDDVITLTLFRIAVPFFFMITGYYVLGPYAETPDYAKAWKIKKTLRQLLKLYLFACLLYLPLSFYNGTLRLSISVSDMAKLLLFDSPFYHLWYFPAVIVGMLICRLLLKHLPYSKVLILVFSLYLIGLGGDSYYFLIQNTALLKKFYDFLFQLFDYTRNGLFFSPLFLVLGAGIYLKKGEKRTFSSLKMIIGLLLLFIEGLLLHRGTELKHDSMYLFLPLTMYFLFQYLLWWKPRHSFVHALDYSLWLYILHPISIIILYFAGKIIPMFQNSLIQFLLILLLTMGLCTFTLSILTRLRQQKPGKIHRAGKVINLTALGRNLRSVEQRLDKGTKIMAVLKADAYGHGAVSCGLYLEKQEVNFFAVAALGEGIELRKNGIQGDILILGYTDPVLLRQVAYYDLIQSVFDLEYAHQLNQTEIKVRCHLEVNTGMNRLGFTPNLEDLLSVYRMENLQWEGIFSHLGSSDTLDEKAEKRTAAQIQRYDQLLEELKQCGIDYGVTHLQSSYGVINYPELSYDYVRVGILLYGVLSQQDQEMRNKIKLEPVLSVHAVLISAKWVSAGEYLGYGTETAAVKEMRVGVVSIGYADGISRELSNSGFSLSYLDYEIPQVGRICMDMLLADITDVPEIKLGTQITVLENSEAAAGQAQTITNEVLSRMGCRLESMNR